MRATSPKRSPLRHSSTGVRRRLGLAVALGMTLVVPAVAGSAVTAAAAAASACGQTPGLVCSQVTVPLDRTGVTAGSISLHVEVLPASGVQRGAMFMIAGGPGQPSAGVFSLGTPADAAYYRSLFPGYALVAYDGRGSGRSGPLDCPSLEGFAQPGFGGATCAAVLGAKRDFFGTGDQAEDLELVRQSLGFDRVALFGTSYGTKLALAYALAYPTHVERLLLDSVVPLALPDPLSANVLRMIPTALSDFCAGATCTAATPNFSGDVVALANELAARPLAGSVAGPNGSKRAETLDGADLLSLVVAADLNPGLAAELPAAVHAARRGNPQPLLRTLELDQLGSSGRQANDVSAAVYAATLCHDGPFPWVPSSPLANRSELLQAAIDALPSGSLGPFGHWATLLGDAWLCVAWPSVAGGAALGAGPLPDVPMLALSGGFDMRTPTVDAASVVAQFPQGHLLVVPGIGHGVLESGATCPQIAVRSWLDGKPVADRCARPKPLVAPVAAFSAGNARPTHPAGPAQTLAVAANTAREAAAAWLLLLESGGTGATAPGIYGGTLHVAAANVIELTRYSITRGVAVSGTLQVTRPTYPLVFAGSLTVTGAGASVGRLDASGPHFRGVLGGRRVSR